jgi:6-phosphogluconate dehydrogenase
MQIGMIGLGRMGANMVRRLQRGGHQCVVFDKNQDNVKGLVTEGATGATTIEDFAAKLKPPRATWLMVPAAAVDDTLHGLCAQMQKDDIVVDGGNSYYIDDIRRARELMPRGVHYLDVGTSGGVWGFERGFCLMSGGEAEPVRRLDPVFKTLAPGRGDISRTPGREKSAGTAEEGYLYCGPSGAGHFVKMVHNGIEYGLMEAYAEGLNILRHANAGKQSRTVDAETTPLRNPEHYQYDFNLADVSEVWRRGSVIASWLLDLTATALFGQQDLSKFSGRVSDSGEGRWTINAAIDEGVPAPVLSAALYQRFTSRGDEDFANKLLSAMRFEFGGHVDVGRTHMKVLATGEDEERKIPSGSKMTARSLGASPSRSGGLASAGAGCSQHVDRLLRSQYRPGCRSRRRCGTSFSNQSDIFPRRPA